MWTRIYAIPIKLIIFLAVRKCEYRLSKRELSIFSICVAAGINFYPMVINKDGVVAMNTIA